MHEQGLARTVLTLNVFSALKMTLFPMAIITVFWQVEIGLGLTEIFVLQVLFSLTGVLMEYPSGYVSDRLGYTRSLIIACLFGIGGWSAYLVAETFWQVLGAEVLLGVSFAFISGSDTAFLFETLRAAGRTDLYARCDGRMVGWAQGGEAVGALCAGILYSAWPLLPFVAQVGVWMVALVLCLTLTEPVMERQTAIASHMTEALSLCRQAWSRPPIRSVFVLGMLLGLASFYMVWLVQPFMYACAVPVTWFGPVWAGANIVVAVAAANSHRIVRRWGPRRMVGICFFLVVVGYAGLAASPVLGGFLFYYLLTAMRGLQGPLLRSRLQLLGERRNRAALLSLHSLIFRAGFVLSGPGVGWLADTFGLSTTFALLGGAFALAIPLAGREFLRHDPGVFSQDSPKGEK